MQTLRGDTSTKSEIYYIRNFHSINECTDLYQYPDSPSSVLQGILNEVTMSPETRSGVKRVRVLSPTSSEQDILDALPEAGDLITRAEQKKPSDVASAYLIYVITRTGAGALPEVLIRKLYESKTDAVEAFKREYATWVGNSKTSPYSQSHAEEELSREYLINLMDGRKVKTASTEDPDRPKAIVFTGRGKVEYEIVHREDKRMKKEDSRQRKVVIVCEETTIEAF